MYFIIKLIKMFQKSMTTYNRKANSEYVYKRIWQRQKTHDPKKVEREPYKG